MSTEATTKCSTCGELATSKCGGCKVQVYCNRNCQAEDWATHKIFCKDIQMEKNTFDTPIDRIEENEEALVIYDGDQKQNKTYFVKFPNHLMKNEKVRMGVLCAWVCNEPLAFMNQTVSSLFQGLSIVIEEVNVSLKSIPRKTTCVPPHGVHQDNWPNFSHEMYRITSRKSGRQWGVDITGGQYGLCQSCWKWEDFEAKHVEKVNNTYPFGTNRELIRRLGEIKGNPSLTYGLVGLAAVHLDKVVTVWPVKSHVSLSKLLSLDNADFCRPKDDLLKAMDATVYKFIQSTDFTGSVQAAAEHEAKHPGVSAMTCQVMTKEFRDEIRKSNQ